MTYPQPVDSTTPNEETPLVASFSRLSNPQASWLWPSLLSKRLPQSKEPEADSATVDATAESDRANVYIEDIAARKAAIIGTIVVLYFGVWLASADTTMVTAIYNTIGSDFGNFQDVMWILAAYHLGLTPAQPLYGKLSDIFGYRAMLTIAYVLFGIGCIVCGLSSSLIQFAAGRVVTGVGGAGTRSLVSSLIVDLVPCDVAVLRSWMYSWARKQMTDFSLRGKSKNCAHLLYMVPPTNNTF